MGSDENGMPCRVPAEEWLSVFALVIYIPDPLGRFLDDLRRELAPHCNPHAHVSLLPPRPLAVEWQVAAGQARALTEGWAPFEIELVGVRIFPVTNVIYLEIGAGAAELRRLHAAMNAGLLQLRSRFRTIPTSPWRRRYRSRRSGPFMNSPSGDGRNTGAAACFGWSGPYLSGTRWIIVGSTWRSTGWDSRRRSGEYSRLSLRAPLEFRDLTADIGYSRSAPVRGRWACG